MVTGPTSERSRADDQVGATPPDAPDDQLDDEPASARALAYDELVRGYEVEPGRFAMVEREEIEQARKGKGHTQNDSIKRSS